MKNRIIEPEDLAYDLDTTSTSLTLRYQSLSSPSQLLKHVFEALTFDNNSEQPARWMNLAEDGTKLKQF